MATIVVRRHANGEISRINVRPTFWEIIRSALFLALLLIYGAWMISDSIAVFNKTSHHEFYELALGVCTVGASLYLLTTIIIKGGILGKYPETLIANCDGLKFSFYPELGLVPWEVVRHLRIAEAESHIVFEWFYGKKVLVADLEGKNDLLKKINMADRNKQYRKYIPFATLQGDRSINIVLLKKELEELRDQLIRNGDKAERRHVYMASDSGWEVPTPMKPLSRTD